MNSLTKKVFSYGFVYLIIPIFVLSILSVPAFPRVVANYLGSTFNDQGGQRNIGPIETRVINGAAHFLKSYSHFLLFLNKIELWDLQPGNPVELQILLDEATVEIEKAKKEYEILIELAGQSFYNQRAIDMLKKFDFKGFMEKNGLIAGIFQDVEKHLKNGEIIEISMDLNQDFSFILNRLVAFKGDTGLSKLPGNAAVLELQGRYSRALLFGQYVAGILFEIKENI